jgi:hypothetical protein
MKSLVFSNEAMEEIPLSLSLSTVIYAIFTSLYHIRKKPCNHNMPVPNYRPLKSYETKASRGKQQEMHRAYARAFKLCNKYWSRFQYKRCEKPFV